MINNHSLADKAMDMYNKMKGSYIPDTYAKVSMYFPIMAAMELASGKSITETLTNRALVTGTDMINGILVGMSCDYARRKFNAMEEGNRQKLVDTITSITVLDTLYLGYQYIASQLTNRSTETLLPASIGLALILLATGGKYGKRRNDCRKDYSVQGSILNKTRIMIKNDYRRLKNWTISDGSIYLNSLA